MDLKNLEVTLNSIFGEKNVKHYAKGFRIIIEYGSMPYCIVLRLENNRLVMDRDAVDQGEVNYEDAYKKAYKMLIQNKDVLDCEIVI